MLVCGRSTVVSDSSGPDCGALCSDFSSQKVEVCGRKSRRLRRRGDRRNTSTIMLCKDQQVLEINLPVAVQIAVGEVRSLLMEVLRHEGQVAEIDRPIVVD